MTVLSTHDATPGQRLLWLMEHYRGSDTPLNVITCYRLRGPLEPGALQSALDELVVRHESLRTSYVLDRRRRLVLRVHQPRPVALVHERVGPDPALEEAMLRHARVRHDITASPLHVALLEAGPDEAVLVLNIHHLSTDGWSGGVLSQQLGELYRRDATAPRPPSGPGPAWQFAEFARWQQERFDQGVLADSQRFWRERLAGAKPPRLPGRSAGRSAAGQLPGLEHFTLDEQVSLGLADLFRTRRATTFAGTLALFAAVLHAQTGDRDIAFATMFANRPRRELAGTVGFLANLLVLRLLVEEDPSYLDLLTSARNAVLDALAYQEVPYHLVPQVDGERAAGLENIMFQVAVGPEYALRLDGVEVDQIGPPAGMASRFDLEFVLLPRDGRIAGQVWYDRRRFDPEWVRGLVTDFQELASAVLAAPDRPVRELRPRAARSTGGGVQLSTAAGEPGGRW